LFAPRSPTGARIDQARPPEWRILELVCEDDASFVPLEKLTAQPAN
jgi:hypothetical protein